MDSHSWMLYISIVVLLFLSAFFSASETALSTLNKIRLKKRAQDGDVNAKAALELVENYDKTLTTILVGNNLVNIATSTITTLVFTSLLKTYGALVSTIVTTVIVLIFGEILPKSYANLNSDSIALVIARPLKLVSVILTPFSFVFGKLQGAFRKHSDTEDKAPTITEEELLYFIESIEEEGVLEEQESNLVQSALEFDETALREIITPRVNLEAVDVDSTREELIAFLCSANHSRVPVYEGSIDNIIGVLFVRGAMAKLLSGEDSSLREMMDDPYFVHKGMKLSDMLTIFQSKKARMAIVLDEYGGTMGIVTLVDLVEELVGGLYDEEESQLFVQLDDDHFEVGGSYGLWDLFEELGIDDDDRDSDYNTISGWAMNIIGYIPEEGESFLAEGHRFTVLEMDGQRIRRLSAERAPDETVLESAGKAPGNGGEESSR